MERVAVETKLGSGQGAPRETAPGHSQKIKAM